MGKFGDQLAQGAGNALGGVAGAVAGAGMGLLFEGHNDRRQLRQQKKLQDLQIAGQKDMSYYNAQLQNRMQLELWNQTNSEAQMEHLKNAGLNPGLMYGMSGAGGGTAATGMPSGNVSAGEAPKGGGEAMGMAMQQMQLGLMNAQRENIQADTKDKLAGIPNKPLQGENIQANTEKTTIETQLLKIQQSYADDNADQANSQIHLLTEKLRAETSIALQDENVNIRTIQARVDKAKADAINAALTGLSIQSGIQVNQAQINKMSADIQQGWKRLTIEQFKAEIEANFKGLDKIAGNAIETLFNQLTELMGVDVNRQPIHVK